MTAANRQPAFDPYAILHALEAERVTYILVGALARVSEGADEETRGIDLTPSPRQQNFDRLERALESVNARRVDGEPLSLIEGAMSTDPVVLQSDHGEIKLVLEPHGTRGYDDLRRRAIREPLGDGLRPAVAAPGDLVRMLEALGREHDTLKIDAMHRVIELDRGRGLSIER
jgi:hypothetical protein